MGRRVATSVRVTDKDGRNVVLSPGDELPEWATDQVTHDAAFAEPAEEPQFVTAEAASEAEGEGGAAAAETADEETVDEETADGGDVAYGSMRVADLRALIEQRNEGRADEAQLSTEGSKADLIAALEADDRDA